MTKAVKNQSIIFHGSKTEILRQVSICAGMTQKAVKAIWKAAEEKQYLWEDLQTAEGKLIVFGRFNLNSRQPLYFAQVEA